MAWRKWFRRDRQEKDDGIPYRSDLIHNLKSDHVELVALFAEIGACSRRRDRAGLASRLQLFSRRLRAHLLEENICLYVYMKHALRDEAHTLEIITTFQHEMGEIGRKVLRFVERHSVPGEWTGEHFADFEKEFEAIEAALSRRIESEEESLYNLYLPPAAYRA